VEDICAMHWAAKWGKHGLFATAVVGGIAAHITYRLPAYWQGYEAFETPPTLSVILGFFLITVACCLAAIVSTTFLVVSAVQRTPRRYLDFGLILIVIIVFIASWTSTGHRQYYFLRGMREWVSTHANVREIEEWFHTAEKKEMSLSEREVKFIDRSEWPPCVRRLNPASVRIVKVAGVWEGHVVCGGGFLHWGFVVCDSQEVAAGGLDEHTLKVGAASYIFVD
jgi:hypothetical protein